MPHDPFRVSERAKGIRPSGIRKFFELGLSMKNPIDLSIGQPHFDTPEIVKKAASRAIAEGRNRYTVTQGIPELRDALKARYARRFGDIGGEEITVTGGVSGGLMLSFLALLNPGDEILIPDPYFIMYRHLATMVSATAVTFDTYPDFRGTAERVKARITPRTRLIVVNSPSNPTGALMTEAEARDLAKLSDETGIPLVSDEIYEDFIYTGRHVSPREFTRNCIVLGGAGKSLGMTGWRMGWMLAPRELSEKIYTLQQFSFVCAPAPLQWGTLAGLDQDFSAHRQDYRNKRDLVYEGIRAKYQCVKPDGSFYMFPLLPAGAQMDQFIEACIKRELLVVPGSACSERATHFRLCFAASDDKLRRAVVILNEIAGELKR